MSGKTIREAQRELALNSGFGTDIIWDLLPEEDKAVMKEKIKQLIPDQREGQSKVVNLRNTIFRSVWNQRKYTNRTSVSYIFYVMVADEETYGAALNSRKYSCHPVFRCRKCHNDSDTSGCCMIYVDETGRVYQNWQSFIRENVLPAGIMVAPPWGVYNFDKNDQVILGTHFTPNGTPEGKALAFAQSSSAVLGIGAACVPIAALALPVAAPVMAAASFVGLCVGAFTAVTSARNISDRQKHEQSISLTNREARADYLGVVGGAVGVAAAGATRAMTSMAAAGKATKGIEVLVNGMNISSIVISGSGAAHGVLDLMFKYKDGDTITKMDILQLSSSLVLFTHSVYNFQLASQIANNARNNSIKAYRESLSNRQRKMFDKISKETLRIRGGTQGKMDIIRGVNEIPDRQYLNDLFKINKNLNQQNVRPAFGESGIVLNNELPVNTANLRQSVQHQKGPDLLNQITQSIPPSHGSDTHTTKTTENAGLLYSNGIMKRNVDISHDPLKVSSNMKIIAFLEGLAVDFVKNYGKKFMDNISDGQKFQDVVLSMTDNLPEETFHFLMKLAQEFIEMYLQEITQSLKQYIPTESVLFRILKYVLDNFKNYSFVFISQKGPHITNAVKNYYKSLDPNVGRWREKRCPDCYGSFSVCGL